MYTNRTLIAFVHIEKSAGTSLTHLLRYNFPLRHCEVKPLSKDPSPVFSSSDLRKILKINPWVNCISGHSITPYSDLRIGCPNIRYITLLRDPINRYISHYLYAVDVLGYKGTFLDFMDSEEFWNFQIKKIAGVENLKAAKLILDKEFLLVGLVEEFIEFLLLLKWKWPNKQLELFNLHRNKGRKSLKSKIFKDKLDRYMPEIVERNALDIELYNYAKDNWFREKNDYGSSYFLSEQKNINFNNYRMYINFLYRNLYFKPIIALLRIISGRRVRGTY